MLFRWKTIRKIFLLQGRYASKWWDRNVYNPTRNAHGLCCNCWKVMTENILLLQNFVSSKWVTEVNTLTANFTIPANCLIQNYFSYQLTLLQTYSSQMKKFTKWSYYKILTESGQAGWENKYFPESHMACMDAWTLLCSVHSPDLKPNIYPSSPHTQSIST